MINGKDGDMPTVNAEIVGPNTKPKPKEAAMIPKPRGLSFGSVVSDITAIATGIFPAVIPSSIRPKNRKSTLGAKAKVKKERAVPTSENRSIGLLPYLSDIRPIIGVAKN